MTNQEYWKMLQQQWDALGTIRNRTEFQEKGSRAFVRLLHLGYDEALEIPTIVNGIGGNQLTMAYIGAWDDRTFLLFTDRRYTGVYGLHYGTFDVRTMIQNIYHKPEIKRLTINPEGRFRGITITRKLLFDTSEGRIYPKPVGFVPARPH